MSCWCEEAGGSVDFFGLAGFWGRGVVVDMYDVEEEGEREMAVM